ncbi:MutS-like protein [Cecembia rubra]|uniref:MutS-like protein n=1 Tax=Cecembia rubra TaxID=1485585 RepID=A0A2P8DPY6_9BACT|nr:DNA mismatch repair protein [Cecembia rubra]PSK99242.1 MutS-like protein [Cecembia rubra]
MKLDENIYPLSKKLQSLKKKTALTAIFRVLIFILLLIFLILGLAENGWYLLGIPVLSIIFIVLIKHFNTLKDTESFIFELQAMEKEQLKRSSRELGSFDSGEEFLDKGHPFCNDLDLFGQHSLFQLINHTVSKTGRNLLAMQMKKQIDQNMAKEKYKAVEELRCKPGLIRNFEALGRAFLKKEKEKGQFYAWLQKPESWQKHYIFPMVLGPIGGIGILLASFLGLIANAWLGLWVLMGMFFLSLIFKDLQRASRIWPNEGDIKTFRIWSELLEQEKFEESSLQAIHCHFEDGQFSKGLRTLEQVSFLIQNRMNFVYFILNLLCWTDFFLLWKLDRWKKAFGADLAELEKVFDQWQVLISLAAFSNQMSLNGEVFWNGSDLIHCKEIKHPLLKKEVAVGNDFHLEDKKKTILLTGSNMSGKTTFMRTLGINLVMVNLGLRPMAEKLSAGNFQLYTSMRNADNLGESVSSFYSELSRIRKVLEAVKESKHVFFLMDEILKGTNTKDRILGSEALIKQLADGQARGIISTHDIELSELEKTLPYLANFSFHSEIHENEIHFDYKLKAGSCPSFNAHKLMELMGIKFE